MNREIKFRCWDKERKEWLSYFELGKNGAITCYEINETQNLIIQQFTGLLDKNGKEIYEGDIVKYECGCSDGSVYKKIASVEYGEFNCSCCDGVYGWYFDDGDIREAERYEVIGNIFDNADLLNK